MVVEEARQPPNPGQVKAMQNPVIRKRPIVDRQVGAVYIQAARKLKKMIVTMEVGCRSR